MTKLFQKRVFAFAIDYLIIAIYAVGLYLISTFLQSSFNINLSFDAPIKRQVLSFATLTLPVFLYFYLSERSKFKVTVGKKFMNLSIASNSSKSNIFLRNFLKFLPWEIAHVGVHFLFQFENQNIEMPLWNWFLLIIPQVIVFIYFLTILFSKGKSSFYDKMAKTSISF